MMGQWLWRSALGMLATGVFLLALLLYWPAVDWLPRILPDGVNVQGVEGSLRQGSVRTLQVEGRVTGPWRWAVLSPAALAVELGEVGQRPWRIRLDGWPPSWRAVIAGGEAHWLQGTARTVLSADVTGTIHLQGRWQGCVSSTGHWLTDDLRLDQPRPLRLGAARLALDCRGKPTLRLDVRRPDAHRLSGAVELSPWHGVLDAQVEPGSELGAIAEESGLMAPGQSRFQWRF